MKRIIAIILALSIFITGCSSSDNSNVSNIVSDSQQDNVSQDVSQNVQDDYIITELSDPLLLDVLEESVYDDVVTAFDSEQYFVENVSAIYISQEYIDELAYNSTSNIFFGYTLSELNEQFEGTKYVFTLGDDGKTTVKEFEEYDDTYDRVLKDIAIGTGVILICVTVSVLTAGTASTAAVSVIFAAAAKGAAIGALEGAAFGGVAAGAVTAVQTGDFEQTVKSAAIAASDGFKWGAITGAICGGAGKATELMGASLISELTINQLAIIQRESKWPAGFIKQLNSMDEYNILKSNGRKLFKIDGKEVLVPDNIDWNYIDADGLTNLERAKLGKSILDNDGVAYEVHHIGQNNDGPFALLTQPEHRQDGNYKILHYKSNSDVEHTSAFQKLKKEIYKKVYDLHLTGKA